LKKKGDFIMGMIFNPEDETLNNNILLNEMALVARTGKISVHVERE
jgi:hypothetical protein